jgi:hypothetical protein
MGEKLESTVDISCTKTSKKKRNSKTSKFNKPRYSASITATISSSPTSSLSSMLNEVLENENENQDDVEIVWEGRRKEETEETRNSNSAEETTPKSNSTDETEDSYSPVSLTGSPKWPPSTSSDSDDWDESDTIPTNNVTPEYDPTSTQVSSPINPDLQTRCLYRCCEFKSTNDSGVVQHIQVIHLGEMGEYKKFHFK